MLLRFRAGEHKVDFELYGAQAESVVGVYDSLRSAIIDVTADAIVLREAGEIYLKILEEQDDGDMLKVVVGQVAQCRAFAEQPTDVFLVKRGKADAPEVPFFSFPEGLGAVAERLIADLAALGKAMNSDYQLIPAALTLLRSLDDAAAPSVLPTPIKSAKRRPMHQEGM